MRGIIDVELRKLAGEYIAEAWYDACECCKGFYELEDAVGQGCNEYEYRFEPKRRQYSNRINCIHIEDFVQEQLDFCLRNEEREQKLRRLQLKANRDIGTLASYTEVDKESIEELSRYAVESVRKKFDLRMAASAKGHATADGVIRNMVFLWCKQGLTRSIGGGLYEKC